MASVASYREDACHIIDEIEKRFRELEENSVLLFVSAREIQRTFRGYITRKHLKKVNWHAVVIQRHWRGFLGRNKHRKRLKEKYDEMCWAHYNLMAKRIQKSWRGFWVRTRIFSYFELKSWLGFVEQQNLLLRKSLDTYRNERNTANIEQRENEAREWIVYILFKLHHLLRTHQLSGIYSLPNTATLSEIEKMLQCLKYKDFMLFYHSYMEDVQAKKAKELPSFILKGCKYPAHFEREWYEHKKPHKDLIFTRGSFVEQSEMRQDFPSPVASDDDAQCPCVNHCHCHYITVNELNE